jgi:uncharacterized protein
MSEKIIRDPVHDVIAFRLDREGDRLLWNLLQSVELQRLRRVRQLGLAAFAYPGAEHTRYSHCLGVLEMTRRILDQLERVVVIDPRHRLATECAALLHDLGHGPFSHVFERVSGVSHELVTTRVIRSPESQVNRLLNSVDPALVGIITALLTHAPTPLPPFLSSCISSQLDADRLDYLLRDDLMTGARYGQYDVQWLIRSLTVHTDTGRLAVGYKGVSAVEGYLQARQHMYRNVYFHKTVRAAEGMLRLALQRARRLAVQERLPGADPALTKALLGLEVAIPELITLDDVSVLHSFKLWTQSDDLVLASLCQGLLFRKLFKTVELPLGIQPVTAATALQAAVEAVDRAGGDTSYDLFYDEPTHTPYEAVSPSDPAGANEIQLLTATGQLRPFAAVSPFVSSLGQYAFRRIHVAEAFKAPVLAAVELAISG